MNKILFQYERKVLSDMIKSDEKRHTNLSQIDEDYFLNHEHKMIYYIIRDKRALSEFDMLVEVSNDGIKNNYSTDEFVDFVEMESMFLLESSALSELVRFKRYRELKKRFDNINPYDPTEEAIQSLYVEVDDNNSNTNNYIDHDGCYSMIVKKNNNFDENGKHIQKDKILTGLKAYDDMVNGSNLGLHILSGAGGCGKTSFAIQLSLSYARTNPTKLGIFFTGEVALSAMAEKVISYDTKIDANKVQNWELGSAQINTFGFRKSKAMQNMFFVECNNISVNESKIIIKKIEEQMNMQAGHVVYDYLQLMKPNDKNVRSEAEYYSRISGDLREMGKIVPTYAISNLTKNAEGGHCPSVRDLKGSSQIEFDATTIMMLWKKDAEKRNEISCAIVKNRFGQAPIFSEWNFEGVNGTFAFQQLGLRKEEQKSSPKFQRRN